MTFIWTFQVKLSWSVTSLPTPEQYVFTFFLLQGFQNCRAKSVKTITVDHHANFLIEMQAATVSHIDEEGIVII